MYRIQQALIVLQRRGLRYLLYLSTGYALPRAVNTLLYQLPRSQARRFILIGAGGVALLMGAALVFLAGWGMTLAIVVGAGFMAALGLRLRKALRIQRKLDFARQAKGHPIGAFTKWADYPAQAATRQEVEAARGGARGEVVIGQIDNDGRVHGPFGPLPYVHNIAREEFVPRYRFPLEIVLLDDLVLIRKDFRGDRERFACEWHNLARLDGEANTPVVYKVDEARGVLYKNLIVGRTVRDILVEAGADILTVNVEQDESLKGLSEDERIYAVWARGKNLLTSVFAESFFERLEEQLNRVHARGLAKLSLTFGNIMIDNTAGLPWLIDMEGAEYFENPQGIWFNFERDRDREKYDQIYGRSLLTERSARRILREQFANTYAPIDFGRGLATHGFWSTDSGTGRWDYLNGRVVAPLVRGKRVLDLGINNGIMDLMMLKSGATSVVGLEFSAEYAALARQVHQLFEWRDVRKYDFTVHNCDMREVLQTSFGEFEVVTAFCSLYYLEAEDMAAVVRKAAAIAPMMILQAKTHARPQAEEKGQKSSLEFLSHVLVENGFPNVETIAPKGFTRPILIGRKEER